MFALADLTVVANFVRLPPFIQPEERPLKKNRRGSSSPKLSARAAVFSLFPSLFDGWSSCLPTNQPTSPATSYEEYAEKRASPDTETSAPMETGGPAEGPDTRQTYLPASTDDALRTDKEPLAKSTWRSVVGNVSPEK